MLVIRIVVNSSACCRVAIHTFFIAYNASAAAADTAETIGKLYGGDWMLMPYNGSTDINVASSTTEIQYLEYMIFADGIVEALG